MRKEGVDHKVCQLHRVKHNFTFCAIVICYINKARKEKRVFKECKVRKVKQVTWDHVEQVLVSIEVEH